MRRYIFIITSIFFLTNCTYHPTEKQLTEYYDNDGRIIKSFYKLSNDTIKFKRVIKNNYSKHIIQSGRIYFGEYALTYQMIDSTHQISNSFNTDSLTKLFDLKGYSQKLVDEKDVLFIQIIPDNNMGTFESLGFLNLRQEIEGEIDHRLQKENLGEWFAGDMGAGGNMLFFINDWQRSIDVVIKLLKEEGLIDHVLIAKRIMTSNDDWNYEIIYPLNYEGAFNQM